MSAKCKDNCYAIAWSYGTICVYCDCCKPKAYKQRLQYHKEQLKHNLNMQKEKDLLDIQIINIKANIIYEKKKIKQLLDKIKKASEG